MKINSFIQIWIGMGLPWTSKIRNERSKVAPEKKSGRDNKKLVMLFQSEQNTTG
jgi:hypothetical protein